MRWQLVIGVLLLISGAPFAVAAPRSIAERVAALESDDFTEREAAEAELVALGIALLDKVKTPPPGAAPPEEVKAQLADFERRLQAALASGLYQELQPRGFEGRFRAARIREQLAKAVADRLAEARARHPADLPPDELERLHGYTGGFRDGTTWFDAEFHNHSQWTIHSIRCLVRVTDKAGKDRERVVTFTDPEHPLLPGGKAKWSADVGFARGANFYWEKQSAVGRPK